MMDQFTRDALAIAIVVYGLIVALLEFSTWRMSKVRYRWVFLVEGTAGILCSLTFSASLLRLYSQGDVIDAVVGRPLYLILLTALVISSIADHRRGTNDCN